MLSISNSIQVLSSRLQKRRHDTGRQGARSRLSSGPCLNVTDRLTQSKNTILEEALRIVETDPRCKAEWSAVFDEIVASFHELTGKRGVCPQNFEATLKHLRARREISGDDASISTFISEYQALGCGITAVMKRGELYLHTKESDWLQAQLEARVQVVAEEFVRLQAFESDQFVTALAHDLLTRLTVIQMSAQFMERYPDLAPESETSMLAAILRSVRRADEQLQNLLAS